MRRILTMALLIMLGTSAPAAAGGPPSPPRPFAPSPRPTVSPYINLLNPLNHPALNYYGLVRPQFEFRADLGRLTQEVAATPDARRDAGAPLVTGHRSYFFSYAPYFSGTGTTPASGAAAALAPPAPPAAAPRTLTAPGRGLRR